MIPPRIDPGRLARSLHVVHQRLDDDDLQPVLQGVLDVCDEVFSLAGCGLLLEDAESGLQFVAATSEASRRLEERQVALAEGPCVDAFIEATVIETVDLGADARWPDLSKQADELVVRAVLGCPVRVSGISVGSLDVYLDEVHAWDESERRAIASFADVIGSTLGSAIRAQQASDIADQLRHALESRVVIERSVGFLMARAGLSASAAFELLRSSARSQRRKVQDLARELLEGRATLPDLRGGADLEAQWRPTSS